MAHVAILCDHLAGKLSLLMQKVCLRSPAFQARSKRESLSTCQHTNLLSAPFIICFQCVDFKLVLFSLAFCLSVSDKSFDSRFLFNILSHTNILLRFLSLSLSLSFSVTLNVILYFTNLRLFFFFYYSISLPSHCNVCFCLFLQVFVFPFSSSWIRQECVCVWFALSAGYYL